jgi:hypothetical protein
VSDLGELPAFPRIIRTVLGNEYPQDGLSKREWLAGMALQGLLANAERYENLIVGQGEHIDAYLINSAARAVKAADALLASLEARSGPTHTEATPEP